MRSPTSSTGRSPSCSRPGTASTPVAAPVDRRAGRRGDLGRRHPVAPAGPAGRTPTAQVRRHRRRTAQRHRPGRAGPGLIIALVRFGQAPCVFLGQDRRADHPMGPSALREARRGMRLASELGLPLVTAIDTQGAALSPEAENGGLAGEIARCLADLVTLDSPTLCLMLGEGNGGGALALLPADRVIAAQHAWLSPLPPEGASRDRLPRPRPRAGDGAGRSRCGPGTCTSSGSSTGSWLESDPTPPTSRRHSANGSGGARARARLAPRTRGRLTGGPGPPLRCRPMKTYVVSGAASGIGAATTALLERAGPPGDHRRPARRRRRRRPVDARGTRRSRRRACRR